ncbi:MAG: 50S ribosomal protein L3 [Candidatus Margulisbacteria bacterium]|nr:50S ribosomal protein L3 [Candidatus Margulisiibacteriota bacterium]
MKKINKGLVTKKIGMTKLFNEAGEALSVTVLQVVENKIIQKKTMDNDGYESVRVGYSPEKESKVSKPNQGQFKAVEGLFRKIKEFKFADMSKFEVGASLPASMFDINEEVNATGTTKGRGFTGTVKRYNFTISPMAHGSKNHRRCGSIGAGTSPGKVWKGQKMPGHYGNTTVTIKNLKIVKIDQERSLVLVKGAVPGANGSEIVLYN